MDHNMPCYTAVVQTFHYGIGVDKNTWYVICSPAPPSETNTHTRKPDIRWRESNMSVRRHANVNLSGDDVCQQKYSSSDSWSLSPVGKTRNYVNANPSFIVFGAIRQRKTYTEYIRRYLFYSKYHIGSFCQTYTSSSINTVLFFWRT